MKDNGRPPVIIIGMHRSGTAILSRMLEELGLFVGKRKEKNNEAIFFLRINEWLLQQCSANWDHPKPFNQLVLNEELRDYAQNYIRMLIKSPYAISFVGVKKYLRYRSIENLDISWGWKDPRNTFTLPLWLEIFPNAKVIHIHRHGLDVANSLKVRHENNIQKISNYNFINKMIYWIKPEKFWITIRCASLRGGIDLWEEYLHQAGAHVERLGEMATEVKYEDLVLEPYETLKSLSRFCELSVMESTVKDVAKKVKKSRAYAYLSDPELRHFSGKVADRLSLFGY